MLEKLDFRGMSQESKHYDPLYEKDREVWEQIVIALNFFLAEEDRRDIILQCEASADIPHVRRTVVNLLGQPNRFGSTRLEYPEGTIYVVSVWDSKSMNGLRGLPFYLSRGSENDMLVSTTLPLDKDPFPYSILQIWEDMGLSAGEMVQEVVKKSEYHTFWAFTLIETYLHDKECLQW